MSNNYTTVRIGSNSAIESVELKKKTCTKFSARNSITLTYSFKTSRMKLKRLLNTFLSGSVEFFQVSQLVDWVPTCSSLTRKKVYKMFVTQRFDWKLPKTITTLGHKVSFACTAGNYVQNNQWRYVWTDDHYYHTFSRRFTKQKWFSIVSTYSRVPNKRRFFCSLMD